MSSVIPLKMKISKLPINKFGEIEYLWKMLNQTHENNSNCWKGHFKELTFDKRLETIKRADEIAVFVAKNSEDLLAYCIVSIKKYVGEIDSIFIKNEYRNSGIGHSLPSESQRRLEEKEAKEISVEVAEGNIIHESI